eukprot:2900604-Rhodomonas_salina.2
MACWVWVWVPCSLPQLSSAARALTQWRALVQDEKGFKMSKSLGNVIDPRLVSATLVSNTPVFLCKYCLRIPEAVPRAYKTAYAMPGAGIQYGIRHAWYWHTVRHTPCRVPAH